MRVLVVDDEPVVRHVVRRSLLREGFEVVEAADADGALAALAQDQVEVVVLDLHLPGTSGLELLPLLRAVDPDLHVIMLTGAATEADRVRGLVSGADDYVVKPFSPRELAARVLAVGRRRAASWQEVLQVGGLRIDRVARRVTLDGDPVDLTRREFDLLSHLAANPERTFSREELLRAVWGSSAEWQGQATVTEHMRRLRTKTEPDPAHPRRLVTVRGAGYRFEPGADGGHVEDDRGASEAGRERVLRSAPELSQVANVVIADGIVVDANEAALALVGATDPAEVVGEDLFRFVAPRSHGTSMARQESARAGQWARPEVISLLRLDGEEVLVELASGPVLWDEQPASQITLWDLSGDTTKLRHLATGIRTEVLEAIIVTDTELCIQSFSRGAEELYGWREEEVLGRHMSEVVQCWPEDIEIQRATEAVEREGRWHGELTHRRRDGTALTVRSSTTLLRDGVGRPAGLISVNRPVERPEAPGARGDTSTDLAAEIRRGIEQGEFCVHYQPVVRLDGTGWGGVEALVRWQHPGRGLLAPGAFLGAAERSGQIHALGQVILEQAGEQWAAWHRAGSDLHVSVNLSARQLLDSSLPDRVAAVMAEASMPKGSLWLEVTESTLVDDLHGGAGTLRRLDAVGASISVDDFGTGWASLAYLREAPVHALKIDRVFIDGLGAGTKDAAIVGSIVALGHELDLAVIAEGIETPEQAQLLRGLGCELGQGFLFGRPRPPDELGIGIGLEARQLI